MSIILLDLERGLLLDNLQNGSWKKTSDECKIICGYRYGKSIQDMMTKSKGLETFHELPYTKKRIKKIKEID